MTESRIGTGLRRGYILVKTEPGAAPAVADAAREMPGVSKTDVVKGPFDVILHVRDHQASVSRLLGKVRSLDGVLRALPCWLEPAAEA